MARKLRPEEAQIFGQTLNAHSPAEAAALIRSLIEKPDEPLELTWEPDAWNKDSPPEPLGS